MRVDSLFNIKKIESSVVQEKGIIAKYTDNIIGKLVDYTPKIVVAILLLVLGLWLIKRISKLAEKAMLRRELDISLRTFLKSLISIGLKIILIVTVAGMIGIGTTSFVTILGAAGLAVGLALQGSLSNFAGGVLILIFKPFKVGDTIEAQGQSGEVKEIQIFNTLLLTGDHKTVILPNGPLSNGTIVNVTRHGSIRVDVMLLIGVQNDIDKVIEIIKGVVKNNNLILEPQNVNIAIGKVTDGAITINVKPFCKPGDGSSVTSELYHELKKAFDVNGIESPLPKRHLVSDNL